MLSGLVAVQRPASQRAPVPQSPSLLHAGTQAPSRHARSPQSCAAGLTQRPAPSQVDAETAPSPTQVGAAQTAVASGKPHRSPWTPSHVPWQGPVPAHAARPPRGAPVTGVHVPSWPSTSQASHAPVHAELQHTPSTQAPVPHSSVALQRSPAAFTGEHTPALHQCPAAQSLATAHVPAQASAPHVNGAHGCACAGGHAPAPSQLAASVAVPSAQAGARQLLVG